MVRVALKASVDESRGGEGFDGFVSKVGGDGFPTSAVVAFQEGEGELYGNVVPVLSESRH
jgi:hypothetical protein